MAVLRAKTAFSYTDRNGVSRLVKVGDLLNDNDPDVAKRRHLFVPVEEHVEVVERRRVGTPLMETATAEPSSRRSLSRSRGRKGSEPAEPVAPVVQPVVEPVAEPVAETSTETE